MLTPNGNFSAKQAAGRTWRRHMRIERIARLEATGLYSDTDIAMQCGITTQGLAGIKRTPEFKAKMIEIATGVISQFDLNMREDINNSQEELRSMVPMALQKIRSLALSRNENVALRANIEILDREGTLSKVSRTSITLNEKPDLSDVNILSQDILSLLSGQHQTKQEADKSFTISAEAANAQVSMMKDAITEKTLEDIDLSKTRPQ